MAEDNAPKKSWFRRKAEAFYSLFSNTKTADASTQTGASVSPPISRTTSPFSVDSEAASQASTKGSETGLVASEASSGQASRTTKFGTFNRKGLTFEQRTDRLATLTNIFASSFQQTKEEIDARLVEKSKKEADNNAKVVVQKTNAEVEKWLKQVDIVNVTMEKLPEQVERSKVMKAQYAMEEGFRREQEATLTRQAEMKAESKREEAEAAAYAISISRAKALTGTESGPAKLVVQFDNETKTWDGRKELPDNRTTWERERDKFLKESKARAVERAKKIEASRKKTGQAKEEFLSNYNRDGFNDPRLQEERIEKYAQANSLSQQQLEALRKRMGKENGLTHSEIVTSRQGSSKDAKPNSPEVGNPPHPGGHKGLQGLNNKNTRENVGGNEERRSTKLHNKLPPHQHGLCQTPSRLGRPLIPPRTR